MDIQQTGILDVNNVFGNELSLYRCRCFNSPKTSSLEELIRMANQSASASNLDPISLDYDN